jgi:epoxide hydrolase-like predicted phosphatase
MPLPSWQEPNESRRVPSPPASGGPAAKPGEPPCTKTPVQVPSEGDGDAGTDPAGLVSLGDRLASCGVAVRAAIFDGGGVLTTSVTECLLGFERALGLPENTLPPVLRESPPDGVEPAFYQLERGRMTEVEFWRRLQEDLGKGLGVDIALPADLEECRRLLWGSLKPNHRMQAVAEAIARSYRSALLTNGVREWRHLRDLCAPHLFDVVVDSCEVGLRKPEPAIYELVCERLGVRPGEAVFIDDIPLNVAGAEAVGMTGIVFEGTEQAIDALRTLFPDAELN